MSDARLPERIRLKNREEWLAQRRRQGIGASEAAAVMGYSPWLTPLELWRRKTGQSEEKDISDNPDVAEGIRMETAIREMFIARHTELTVTHRQFDILYQKDRPYIFATLDGEYRRLDDPKRRGILECKRSAPVRKADWEQWENGVPTHYYLQILHQLAATGCDEAVLAAALIRKEDEIVYREYAFDRADCAEDMAWYLDGAAAFWKNVQDRKMPAQILRI